MRIINEQSRRAGITPRTELSHPGTGRSGRAGLFRLLLGLAVHPAVRLTRCATASTPSNPSDREAADIGSAVAQAGGVPDPGSAWAHATPSQASSTLEEQVLADLGLSRPLSGPTAGN